MYKLTLPSSAPAMPLAASSSSRSASSCGKAPLSASRPRLCKSARHQLRAVRVAAASASEPEPIEPEPAETEVVAPIAPVNVDPGLSVEDLKAILLDSFFGTQRGLTASAEARAEINELLAQLEAKNPTPSPNEAMELLDGDWKLVYTSNSELTALLAANNLPLVSVGDIVQAVDGATSTITNKVQISVPFSSTTISAQAALEVRSPKRLQVKFNQGTIATPTLTENLDLPPTVSVLGQTLDLKPLQDVAKPVGESLSGLTGQLQNLLNQSPDLNIPITGEQSQTWLITTFLDEDLRVSRGDMGSVFVLAKA